MLERLLTAELFALVLIFCRIGGAIMVMPGIGENFISTRARLLLAFAITLLMGPVLAPGLPRMPPSVPELALLVGGEIAVGVFLSLVLRMVVSGLEMLGTLISFQIGLASATVFNPMLSDSGSLPGLLLVTTGLLLLLQTDMHHLMLRAAFDSYSLFIPGNLPPVGDFSEVITRTAARSFRFAMQLAVPFLLLTTILYIALGLLSRLTPQLQIFFVALPLQLVLGFLLMALSLSAVMLVFLERFSTVVGGFLVPS